MTCLVLNMLVSMTWLRLTAPPVPTLMPEFWPIMPSSLQKSLKALKKWKPPPNAKLLSPPISKLGSLYFTTRVVADPLLSSVGMCKSLFTYHVLMIPSIADSVMSPFRVDYDSIATNYQGSPMEVCSQVNAHPIEVNWINTLVAKGFPIDEVAVPFDTVLSWLEIIGAPVQRALASFL